MLKTAFAAALLIGAASAAQAQTYTFSGLKGSTLTLTAGGSGAYTGSFTPQGGSAFDALGFSDSYAGKGTLTVSTIDLAKGSDYDVIFVLAKKGSKYTEYAAAQSAAFKKVGSGTYKTKK